MRLTVIVENEAAPHVRRRSTIQESEQEIDMAGFLRELTRPGTGTANVFAEVDDSTAKNARHRSARSDRAKLLRSCC